MTARTTLLLNATDEPLCIIPMTRAAVLVAEAKASIVVPGTTLRSTSTCLEAPSVARLNRYVHVPYREPNPTLRGLIIRDHGACLYCGRHGAKTVDHVTPRSKGGQHTWDNVVLACYRCNQRKGDKTLDELGWELRKKPHVPRWPRFAGYFASVHRDEWRPWLVAQLAAS